MLEKIVGTLITFLLFFSAPIYSNTQFKLAGWKRYTSTYNANCVTVANNNTLLVGTTGGLSSFGYSLQQDTLYFITEEFNNLNITALAYNQTFNQTYIGTSNGLLIIVDYNKSETFYINDIKNAKFSNPKINSILFHNNLCYIAGDFGIATFEPQKKVFIESILKLGKFSPNTKVNTILIHNNEIWAGCETGIAKANLNSILADPDSWQNFSTENGLIELNIKNICIYKDSFYCTSNKYLYVKEQNNFNIRKTTEDWNFFNSLFTFGEQLYIGTYFHLYSIDNLVAYTSYPTLLNRISPISINNTQKIAFLSRDKGIGFNKEDSIVFMETNNPSTNIMGDLSFAEDVLWIATDQSQASKGLMLFKNNKWHNIYLEKYPQLKTNRIHKINAINNNTAIASSWGEGFFIIQFLSSDSINFTQYNHLNSALKGITSDPNYVVTGESQIDNQKIIWIVNAFTKSSDPVLIAMDENKNFFSFTNCSGNPNSYLILTIDKFGTKWLGSNENSGLLYINENNTLANSNDDLCGSITTTGTNLPSNTINTLNVDENGFLWIGTSSGLAVLLNPNFIFQKNTPIIRKISSLGNQTINDIMIDALNNKWIATPNGVWVLNSDASEVLSIITVNNSLLIDNNILSLATNKQNGKVYFSSNYGLNEVQSLSITPLNDFDIKIYPQPFYPSIQNELVIDGLAPNSNLIITTTNGEYIKTLTAEGKKVIWDGKLDDGSYISSGVYLVICSSAITNSKTVAKFVVVRK